MRATFLKVGQISVRQISDMLLHIVLRRGNKQVADSITDAARTAMQHYPYPLLFIRAHFNKVIAGTQCSEMLMIIGFQQLRIFVRQALKARSQ